MLWNRKIQLVILLFIILQSCIEPFKPETATYDYNLFIEALITDEPGFLPEVSISSTVPLATKEESDVPERPDAIIDAEVFLLSDDGSEYEFDPPEEQAPNSKYRLSDPNFLAESGKSYKIVIHLDGEVFESDFETLKKSFAIDSLGYQVKTMKLTDDGESVEGYQFLVSNHSNEPEPSYCRWILDATYRYRIPYTSDFLWDGKDLVPHTTSGIRECWKNKNISGVYLSTSEGLSENSIIEAPLHFESQHGDELTIRYSLNAKQLNISKESYYFWNEIYKMIYQSGGLFESQPFRISGNITCTSNPDLNVIGIFEVAGVSEFREFFKNPDEFPVLGQVCLLDTTNTEDYPLRYLNPGSYVLYEEETNAYLTSTRSCFDCRDRGGSITKPPFWEIN